MDKKQSFQNWKTKCGENMNPIILVVGARPNFMKIAPIQKELDSRGIPNILLHTGQHYDDNMSKVFFDDLKMKKPDIYLGVGSGSHATQTAKVMVEFEEVCIQHKPSMVVVVGDVNSTLACSLVSAKLNIKCAHVEAGLRSFDREMPEEINRIVTDSICDILFTPSVDGDENLLNEGVKESKIHMVGNVMIDSLFSNLEFANNLDILAQYGISKDYALVTLHRPSNVDDKTIFSNIINALESLSGDVEFVFPMHPRTKKMAEKFNLYNRIASIPGMKITAPVGYLEFISLMSNSRLVLTDSGGLQEETTALGIPCLTIRENTERPITITQGTNQLVGTNTQKIIQSGIEALSGQGKAGKIPKYWDGKTSSRIVDVILNSIDD